MGSAVLFIDKLKGTDTNNTNTEIWLFYSKSYDMPRALNLRQIEIFKAVVEHGTVSRAAELLWISQPAATKLLQNLEADTGLTLFDRKKGKLIPTDIGLRIYEEVERIFLGVRQVETVIDTVRRENQEQLSIGVIPALADTFIQSTTMRFLAVHPTVQCSVTPMASQWVAEKVRQGQIDVGLLSERANDPSLATQSILEHPLVCIMPVGHPLARHKQIEPEMLDNLPFVSFKPDSYVGQKVQTMFVQHGIRQNTVLRTAGNPALREFVAAGLGVSLVHPLFVAGVMERLVIRPFVPDIPSDLVLCHLREGRNVKYVESFIAETKLEAQRILGSLTSLMRTDSVSLS